MKTEKILSAVVVLGLILKLIVDMPGAGVLLMFSMATLAIIYFPFGFYFLSDKTLKGQLWPLSIIGGFFLFLAVDAVLFKLMFWPGALTLLFLSFALMPFLIAVCIWFYTAGKREDLKLYYKNFLKRSIVWFVLSSIMFAISPQDLKRIQYRNDSRRIDLELLVLEHPDEECFRDDLNRYVDSVFMSEARSNER